VTSQCPRVKVATSSNISSYAVQNHLAHARDTHPQASWSNRYSAGLAARARFRLVAFLALAPHISDMAKRKREYEWEVIRLTASPAKFVGYVRAPDEEAAHEIAIEQFQIGLQQQRSLLIRKH
jgi:hypothetical protein